MKLALLLRALTRPATAAPRPRPVVRRRAAARAAVAFGFVAFVALQLGLSVLTDTRRPEWRDPEYFHRQRNFLRAARWEASTGGTRPTVVVLGSSRAEMGFSPEHAAVGYGPNPPILFNNSQTGCQPLYQRVNLGRALDARPRPNFVLIEVFPISLTSSGPFDGQIPASRMSAADLSRVRPYLSNPDAVRGEWLRAKLLPWHALRFDLLAHAGMAEWSSPRVRQEFLWADMRPSGWSPFYPASWPAAVREQRLALTRQWFSGLLRDYTIHPHAAAAHRELLAECRDNGLRAALFLMPDSPAFQELHPPATRAKVRQYLADLSTEFAVPVFDARTWIDDEAAFMDGYHLLGPGAEAFSQRFGRECLVPWLRNTSKK